MKKYLGILAVALIVPTIGSASVDVGLQYVAPTGDFSDVAGGGFGANLGFYRGINDHVLMGGALGAIAYGGLSIFGTEIQWYGYPLTVGAEYFIKPINEKGLFIKANGGVLYKRATIDDGYDSASDTDTGPLFSPAIGYRAGNVVISAEYNISNNNWTWFSLTAVYRFGN